LLPCEVVLLRRVPAEERRGPAAGRCGEHFI
jgi:hypothetical protein